MNTAQHKTKYIRHNQPGTALGLETRVDIAIICEDVKDGEFIIYHKPIAGDYFSMTSWITEMNESWVNAIFRVKLKQPVNE